MITMVVSLVSGFVLGAVVMFVILYCSVSR